MCLLNVKPPSEQNLNKLYEGLFHHWLFKFDRVEFSQQMFRFLKIRLRLSLCFTSLSAVRLHWCIHCNQITAERIQISSYQITSVPSVLLLSWDTNSDPHLYRHKHSADRVHSHRTQTVSVFKIWRVKLNNRNMTSEPGEQTWTLWQTHHILQNRSRTIRSASPPAGQTAPWHWAVSIFWPTILQYHKWKEEEW